MSNGSEKLSGEGGGGEAYREGLTVTPGEVLPVAATRIMGFYFG